MKRRRQRKDEELNAEIRNHLDEAIRDRIARGEELVPDGKIVKQRRNR